MTITVVNSENREYFEPLASRDILIRSELSIGAIDDKGIACGVLAGIREIDVFRISYLYVSKVCRRSGAATGMLELLGQICGKCGLNGICINLCEEDESGIIEFFMAMNYSRQQIECPIYKFKLEDVNARVLEKKVVVTDGEVVKLGNALDREFNILKNERNELRKVAQTEVIPHIENKEHYNQEISQVLLKDKNPSGCMLVSGQENGIIIDYLYVNGQQFNPIEVMALISEAFRAAVSSREKDSEYYVNAANSSVVGILDKLTSGRMTKCGNSIMLYKYL